MTAYLDVTENFAVHERTCDAEVPEWPHIACDDGYAWHPVPAKRRCFQGRTGAPVALVAAVLHGRPIDRVWSMRLLLVGEHESSPRWPGVAVILFPEECRGCGGSHTQHARLWRRAAFSLHPDALEALREADPPRRLLMDPDIPADRQYRLGHPRVQAPGIPVRGTPEETVRAQIAWALDFKARKEFPVDARRPRRRMVRDVAAR